jgi:predicted acylesterase/phospholipase RssA
MEDDSAVHIVLASAAIPGFFPPVQIGDDWFVDGAVLMNTPLQPAIVAGADVVHVIYLDPDVRAIMRERLDNVISTFERVLLVGRAALVDRDLRMAARINQQLDHARETGMPLGPGLTSRRGKPLKRLTVHRYHPKEDLGGLSGILDMDHGHIRDLIAKGRADALAHDCDASECAL